MHQAVQDAVGEGGIADLGVPLRHRQLTGQDGGTKRIGRGTGVSRWQAGSATTPPLQKHRFAGKRLSSTSRTGAPRTFVPSGRQ